MNELITKLYNNHPVRAIEKDGDAWFVAKDVAEIFGYRDAHNLTRRLDKDEKGTHFLSTPSGKQKTTIISWPGVFVATFGSNKEKAKAFTRWVTHEVLPSIQKTGTYTIPGQEKKLELAPSVRIRMEIEALKAEKVSVEDAWQRLQEINAKIARKELEWCIAHIPEWELEGLLIYVRQKFPDSVRKEVVPVVPEIEDGGEA